MIDDYLIEHRVQHTTNLMPTLFVLIYLFLELMKISKNIGCYFDTIVR